MNEVKKGPFDDDLNAKTIIDIFHQIYYYSRKKTWENTFWMGLPTLKCPLDMWVYQEIIIEIKPEIIIETGTYFGGSALFMAMVCDLLNKGEIITIDVEMKKNRPIHPRIKYLLGSSTSEEIVNQIREIIGDRKKVAVILDSGHSKDHVLEELKIYSKFVSTDSYLIAEDTDLNGHPVRPEFGPGPMEAVEEFMKENHDFIIDSSREKFLMTQNPKGYLKKIK